jgi:hypothetical protein
MMGREVWVNKEDNNHPIFWDFEKNGVLYGKRNKVHTVQIAVKVPKLHADLRLEATNPNGKKQIIECESHSWNRNFYNWLSSAGGGINGVDATNFQDGNINLKDTGGAVRSAAYGICLSPIASTQGGSNGHYALSTISTTGLIIGTGVGAESFEDSAIGTQIVHGSGAGQLWYQSSQTLENDFWTLATRTQAHRLTRFFDNWSGATITINEIAQYTSLYLSSVRVAMMSRDIITPLDVAHRSCAAISYVYSLVFPSTGSPLRNFYNYLFSQFACVNGRDATNFQDGNINIKITAGTVKSQLLPISPYNTSAFGGDGSMYGGGQNKSSNGQIVGRGDTAVTFEDFALETPIEHGTGANQMSYSSASEAPSRVWSDPTMTVQHARCITNGSGSSITVKEVGLQATFPGTGGSSFGACLVLRDIISDVVVANGESIRPIHLMQVTYP